jgi:hypothetical protein
MNERKESKEERDRVNNMADRKKDVCVEREKR